MDLHELISRRMRLRRRELGLTQVQVGERMGWSGTVTSAAEHHNSERPRAWAVADLVRLAMALETTVPWLLTPMSGQPVEVADGIPLDVRLLGDLGPLRDEARHELATATESYEAATEAFEQARCRYELASERVRIAERP